MPSIESRQPMPEKLELPETRVEVDLGTYNPSAEAVKNNWELLGHLATQENEDVKLEFIKSLGVSNSEIISQAVAAKAKRDDPTHPDDSEYRKTRHVFVLRKMLLGHDWRTEDVAGEARIYINQKRKKIAQEILGLRKIQYLSETIAATIASKKNEFDELTAAREKLDETIQIGYPELWDKIKPREAADEFFSENDPPTAAGAIIIKKGTEKPGAAQESKAEKERAARLAQAIEKNLPARFRKCAPEIAQVLTSNGLNFVERNDSVIQNGKIQEVVRFILFVDPLQPEASTNFPNASAQDYEHALPKFANDFKNITASPEISARIKIALNQFFKRRWDFADSADAEAILRHQHAQEKKPFAIYMRDESLDFNLAAIEAQSGKIHFRRQPTDKVPEYKDETVFSALPVFTFDIKKE